MAKSVAVLCEFYGWTVEYALRLPAKTFFIMLQKAAMIRNNRTFRDYKFLSFIAAIPRNTSDYADKLIETFENSLDLDDEKIQDRPKSGALNTDDPLAIGMMCGMFDIYRRSIGGH